MTRNEAIDAIVKAADKAAPGTLIQYAAAYALQMRHMEEGSEELHVQALYTLSNLDRWRGETAKQVKAYLKTL